LCVRICASRQGFVRRFVRQTGLVLLGNIIREVPVPSGSCERIAFAEENSFFGFAVTAAFSEAA
jgi:hypothetical protein